MKQLLLVLSLISCTTIASVIPSEPHIYVEGTSEFGTTPDKIIITVSLSAVNVDAEIAKSEIDQKSLDLFEAVKKLNVEKSDITATPLQINPAFEYEDRKKIDKGTLVNRDIDITLKDITKYSQLNDALVRVGITSKISTIIDVSNEKELKKRALMLALKDARLKAESLAELQNKTIKDVHSISEFSTREDNSYTLNPAQYIFGQSYNVAEQRSRIAPSTSEIFEIGEMTVSAKVFVVYTIE